MCAELNYAIKELAEKKRSQLSPSLGQKPHSILYQEDVNLFLIW